MRAPGTWQVETLGGETRLGKSPHGCEVFPDSWTVAESPNPTHNRQGVVAADDDHAVEVDLVERVDGLRRTILRSAGWIRVGVLPRRAGSKAITPAG